MSGYCKSTSSEHEEPRKGQSWRSAGRSEEHTSELQSQSNLVCRLLLEKKNPACSILRNQLPTLLFRFPQTIPNRIAHRHRTQPANRPCYSSMKHNPVRMPEF